MQKQWSSTPVRPIAYINGILYLSGQDKGVMLQQFLKKTKQKNNITEIIFADDDIQNAEDVANAFKNDRNINVISIHYTGMDAHKAAFLTGPNAAQLQAIENTRWYAIRSALKTQLPGYDNL